MNYNRVNYDLLKLIPPDVDVVVEISCGKSTLGELYCKINPGCEYLEINHQTDALGDNVEEVELQEKDIDCLIYVNVLEHMLDPCSILKRQVVQLKMGGQVIAHIPNLQYWTVISGLMQETCQSKKEELLEFNHLRFFTLEKIQTIFTQAGLTVIEIKSKALGPEGIKQFKDLLYPVATKLGIDPEDFFSQIKDLQYIVRAIKGPPPVSRLLIQSLLGEAKVCARVRINEPHSFIATIPGVRILSEEKTAHLDHTILDEKKVFIWQRILVNDISKQQQLLRRGYLIVAEMDDDPLHWPEHRLNDFLTFRSCHAVQVSTEPLAEFLRQYNPNVAVFPNQLAYLPPPRLYDDCSPVTIFFGALNRESDWLPIISQLNKVLSLYKHKVKVIVIHDRKFFDSIDISDKTFLPFCAYHDYEAVLRSTDIAILPLQPNRFNNMKSDLKFLECAAHGVAALASPTVYERSIIDGKTGVIYHTLSEFAQKLSNLIEDSNFRWEVSHNAYKWVSEHRLLYRNYKERYQWYQSMHKQLPALNRSLEQRVPGIISLLSHL